MKHRLLKDILHHGINIYLLRNTINIQLLNLITTVINHPESIVPIHFSHAGNW